MEDVDNISGHPDATIQLLLYGDYTSQISRRVHRLDFQLAESLEGRAAFLFRHLPGDENAERAARIAIAASLQGKFWEAHANLFELEPAVGRESLETLAAKLGLDWDQMVQDLRARCNLPRI